MPGASGLVIGGSKPPAAAHTWAVANATDRSNTPTVVVVVAVVGLLATVGSAALGGFWANRNVERQLRAERAAEIQDQRREIYLGYLRTTTDVCDAITAGDQADLDRAAVEALNHQARVMLIAGSEVQTAVTEFTNALVFPNQVGLTEQEHPCANAENYVEYQRGFLDAALPEFR